MADQITATITSQIDAGEFQIYQSSSIAAKGSPIGGTHSKAEMENGVIVSIADNTRRIDIESLGDHGGCQAIDKHQNLPLAMMKIGLLHQDITSVTIYDDGSNYLLNGNLPSTADDPYYSHPSLSSDYAVTGKKIGYRVSTKNNTGGVSSWRTKITGTTNTTDFVDSQEIPNGVDGNDLYCSYAGTTIQVASSGDASDTLRIVTSPIIYVSMDNGAFTATVTNVTVGGEIVVGSTPAGETHGEYTEKVGSHAIVVSFNPSSTGDWIEVKDKDNTVLVSKESMGSGIWSWNFNGNSIDTTNGIKIIISQS
jgi:hypothetical protein